MTMVDASEISQPQAGTTTRTTRTTKMYSTLRWLRLVGYSITFGLSIVTGAVCVQLFVRGKGEMKFIRQNLPAGVTIDVDDSDLIGATVAALIGGMILSLVSSHIVIALLQDMFNLLPPRILQKVHIPTDKPISDSTLTLQIRSTIIAIIVTIGTLIPLTVITVRRSAGVKLFMDGMQLPDSFVQMEESMLGVSRVYWNTGYIRCVTAAPWFSLAAAFPSLVVTYASRVLYRRSLIKEREEKVSSVDA